MVDEIDDSARLSDPAAGVNLYAREPAVCAI
jgi:hypothetical protein